MRTRVELIDGFKLDPASRNLCVFGKKVRLRNKEFVLMEYFFLNMGIVLSRTQILEDVWDRNICWSTNTVDVHVSSLRRKIRRFSRMLKIKTVHCVGYVFELR
ncbi:winged helix-turn-helix transcriptional regulator [Candidatus Gracilibacteria bacterium]|nr:winged helix-turn-helix transcriptional regulator [Candidatus Gracilibacteria bacterium]